MTQFGARRDVLGTTLRIDAVAYTIIGVAPEGFVGLWPYRPPVGVRPVWRRTRPARVRRTGRRRTAIAFGIDTDRPPQA